MRPALLHKDAPPKPPSLTGPASCARVYWIGPRYIISPVLRKTSIVSSGVSRVVVLIVLRCPAETAARTAAATAFSSGLR